MIQRFVAFCAMVAAVDAFKCQSLMVASLLPGYASADVIETHPHNVLLNVLPPPISTTSLRRGAEEIVELGAEAAVTGDAQLQWDCATGRGWISGAWSSDSQTLCARASSCTCTSYVWQNCPSDSDSVCMQKMQDVCGVTPLQADNCWTGCETTACNFPSLSACVIGKTCAQYEAAQFKLKCDNKQVANNTACSDADNACSKIGWCKDKSNMTNTNITKSNITYKTPCCIFLGNFTESKVFGFSFGNLWKLKVDYVPESGQAHSYGLGSYLNYDIVQMNGVTVCSDSITDCNGVWNTQDAKYSAGDPLVLTLKALTPEEIRCQNYQNYKDYCSQNTNQCQDSGFVISLNATSRIVCDVTNNRKIVSTENACPQSFTTPFAQKNFICCYGADGVITPPNCGGD